MNEVTTNPLTWPNGWPRTKPASRKKPNFRNHSIPQCTRAILAELKLMGYPDYMVIISSNLIIKSNGQPYATQPRIDDPGVSVWFREYGSNEADRKVLAIDKYSKPWANLWACGLTFNAMRGIDRWSNGGVRERAFTGFAELEHKPDPGGHLINGRTWFDILEVKTAHPGDVYQQYRKLLSKHHPDKGGDPARFHDINQAWEYFNNEVSGT